ncbi:MAG TPA: signal peptidase II [Thermoleophilaceae bacterium]|jgi:signal peptidase II
MGSAGRGWRLAGAAAGLVVAADQATKQMAIASLERGERRNVFLGVDLTHVRNKGVAFGALGDGGALVTALTVAALALLAAYFALNAARPRLWLPVGAVAGGALGNLADRARDGAVTDFLDPIAWPAFNLADAAIVLGVLGLLYLVEGGRPDGDPAAGGNGSRERGGGPAAEAGP